MEKTKKYVVWWQDDNGSDNHVCRSIAGVKRFCRETLPKMELESEDGIVVYIERYEGDECIGLADCTLPEDRHLWWAEIRSAIVNGHCFG